MTTRRCLALAIVVLGAALCATTAPAADNPHATKAQSKSKSVRKAPPAPMVKAAPPSYARRPDVRDFVDGLVATGRFDRDALMRLFADARYSDTAARLMAPAASTGLRRDWAVYRARFIEPVRLGAGFRFWDDNQASLARAERDFGVPAEIIVGILGVETVYGRNTGGFRVIDALATLSFDYPNRERDRSTYFREQLSDALAMDRDGEVDLATLRGSYAGAIGMPQFMPGSILRYAVDYDGDGHVDLVGSPSDVIGSVGNYLARHGWIRDVTTHVALSHPSGVDAARAARIDAMVATGSVPSLDLGDLVDAGFVAQSLPPMGKLALIDLPLGNDARGAPQVGYVAGTQNFHVITRYNRSYFYAMAVIELGATIKALRDARWAMNPPTSP